MKISIRSMVQAPPGYVLIAFDLSQAESWIVAHLADEPNMKRALTTGDIHTETAGSALFHNATGCPHDWKKDSTLCSRCGAEVTKVMRYVGKRYNHASAYRMGAERAAQVINKDSDKPPYFTVTIRESKKFSDAWHAYYNLKVWWNNIERQLSDTHTLTTTYGRKRMFYAGWGPELFKEATAFEPQSTVADHFNGAIHPDLGIKGGLLEIFRTLVKPYRDHKVINQAHDSAILEVPTAAASNLVPELKTLLLRPLIVKGVQFTIPVDVEVGERMGELEKVA